MSLFNLWQALALSFAFQLQYGFLISKGGAMKKNLSKTKPIYWNLAKSWKCHTHSPAVESSFFIRTQSDHWLPLSLTDSLHNTMLFCKFDACEWCQLLDDACSSESVLSTIGKWCQTLLKSYVDKILANGYKSSDSQSGQEEGSNSWLSDIQCGEEEGPNTCRGYCRCWCWCWETCWQQFGAYSEA